jgi:phosphatidylglycerophosphate synthase
MRRGGPRRDALGFPTAATNRTEPRRDALLEGAQRARRVAGDGVERTELERERRHRALAARIHRATELALESVAIACARRAACGDFGRRRDVFACAGADREVVEDAACDPLEASKIVGAHFQHAAASSQPAHIEIEHDDDVAPFSRDHPIIGPRQTLFEHEPSCHVVQLSAPENPRPVVELDAVTEAIERNQVGRFGMRKRPYRVPTRGHCVTHPRRGEQSRGAFGLASVVGHAYLLAPATIMTNDEGWYLFLDPAAPAKVDEEPWFARRLLGLSVLLRLALTAQAAGARGIVLSAGGEREAMRKALADERRKIDVYDDGDPALGNIASEGPAIRIPANLVVHRAAFVALVAQWPEKAAMRDAAHQGRGEGIFEPGISETNAVWQMASTAAGPYGFSPIAVRDRKTFEAAERMLLRALRKPQDGWTSTHLNRPISLAITRRLVGTSLRPNQVSVAILGVGLLGAFLASRGTYASLVAGAALFHTQSVLDGCDGEMSRLTFRGSHTGEWLDTIGDDLTNYGFFGGAAYGLFAQTGQTLYLALGGLTVFCGLVGSGLEYRYLVKIGSGDLLKYPLGIGKAPGNADEGSKSGIAKLLDGIAPLFKRDTFVLLTFLGAVIGVTGPLLAVFTVGALGVLIAVLKAEMRMARERAARAATTGHGAAEPSERRAG